MDKWEIGMLGEENKVIVEAPLPPQAIDEAQERLGKGHMSRTEFILEVEMRRV